MITYQIKIIKKISTKDPLNPKDFNISNHMKIPSLTSEAKNVKDPSTTIGSKASSNIFNTKEDHPSPYDGKIPPFPKLPLKHDTKLSKHMTHHPRNLKIIQTHTSH